MSQLCILTDNTAQFTAPDFAGHGLVKRISFKLSSNRKNDPRIQAPNEQDFFAQYNLLARDYEAVLVLTSSGKLSQAATNARNASRACTRREQIQVIDTLAVGLGLGLIVQQAAAAASAGASLVETGRLVLARLNQVYSLFCFQGMAGLVQLKQLEPSQAVIAGMMGMIPFYTLEDGGLLPAFKVKTTRHILESFLEFAGEFHAPQCIGFTRPVRLNGFRDQALKQAIQETFPQTIYIEQSIQPPLQALFGSHFMCLTVMEETQ